MLGCLISPTYFPAPVMNFGSSIRVRDCPVSCFCCFSTTTCWVADIRPWLPPRQAKKLSVFVSTASSCSFFWLSVAQLLLEGRDDLVDVLRCSAVHQAGTHARHHSA